MSRGYLKNIFLNLDRCRLQLIFIVETDKKFTWRDLIYGSN